ncbi:MAG: hypothetical protein ACI4Q4_06675, partial [Oscillospiraceae bacterium]
MKLLIFGTDACFFSSRMRISRYLNGGEKICRADIIHIDTYPFLIRDEEQRPDTAHCISVKKRKDKIHFGITERHYFEEYMTLKDRLLDRISQGEDIVLFVDGFFGIDDVTY